jgi:hypothetical protein
MKIIRVLVEELLCQTVMGRIPILMSLLPGARGCLWPHPIVPDIKCRYFQRTRLPWCLPDTKSPRAWLSEAWACPEVGGMRRTELTGGEILPTHSYRDKGWYWCRLLPGLVLFRLVVHPLQPGVVGPYLIQSIWFPSHLPPEGTWL